jgi:hypothetical protein
MKIEYEVFAENSLLEKFWKGEAKEFFFVEYHFNKPLNYTLKMFAFHCPVINKIIEILCREAMLNWILPNFGMEALE